MFKKILISVALMLGLLATNIAVAESTVTEKSSSQAVVEKINLNTANAEQLQTALKGVGQKKAEAIVAFREQIGGFKTVEQLVDVKGIGNAILEKNRGVIEL